MLQVEKVACCLVPSGATNTAASTSTWKRAYMQPLQQFEIRTSTTLCLFDVALIVPEAHFELSSRAHKSSPFSFC